jgi:Family of unknown function (DUF6796)
MNESNKNVILITGIVGILGAVLMVISDLMISAIPFSGKEALELGLDSFLYISQNRLTIGTIMGVLCIPFCIIGLLQIYIGVRPAGKLWSIPITIFLFYAMVVGAVFHSSVGFLGTAQKTLHAIGEGYSSHLSEMMNIFTNYNNMYLYIILVCMVIGSLLFAVAVITAKTTYPRWMSIFNPLFIYIFLYIIFLNLPSPVGGYIIYANFNLTIFIFLVLSTIALVRRERLNTE